jgi:hypothetical protein
MPGQASQCLIIALYRVTAVIQITKMTILIPAQLQRRYVVAQLDHLACNNKQLIDQAQAQL